MAADTDFHRSARWYNIGFIGDIDLKVYPALHQDDSI